MLFSFYEMGIKEFAIFEAVVIVLLLGVLIYTDITQPTQTQNFLPTNSSGLISSRIYSGLLAPQSYLILNYDPLKDELKQNIMANNLTISVYVENLRSGAYMSINGNQTYNSASMSKVPLAILVMKKIESGELTLDTELPILNSDRTSSWGELYNTSTEHLSIRVLLEQMLQESDNTAFNVLYRNVDQADFENLLSNYYGIESTSSITTRSFYNIFSGLYLSTVLTPEDSEYILQLLTNTTFDIGRIANIPADVTISHKFGSRYKGDEKYFHDCGIFYKAELRVFYCIMTKDMDQDTAVEANAYILNRIYNYTVETRAQLDKYKDE